MRKRVSSRNWMRVWEVQAFLAFFDKEKKSVIAFCPVTAPCPAAGSHFPFHEHPVWVAVHVRSLADMPPHIVLVPGTPVAEMKTRLRHLGKME